MAAILLLEEVLRGGVPLTQHDTGTLTSGARRSKANIALVLAAAWFAVFGVMIVARSMHWPTVHDSPILIYMVFLSEHGMRLYRDIVEVQFPGSVLLYSFEWHVFGKSALGFRLFDLCGLGAALASMLVIARRRGYWFAAVFGFAYFLLAHTGSWTSIMDLGQRDFFMTCLLGAGVAFLVESYRRQRPLLMAGFGLWVALASTIKPTAIVFAIALIPVVLELRRQGIAIRSYFGYILAGGAAGWGVVVCYLLYERAFGAFLHLEWTIVPLYSGIASMSYPEMLRLLDYPGHLFPVLAGGAVFLVALQEKVWRNVEQQVLLLSAITGAASFLLQHKGFFYHRLPFVFFFFLWVGWVIAATVREGRESYVWASVALVALSMVYYPHLIQVPHWDDWGESSLQSDLVRLHAMDRPGQVQCIDTTRGCLAVVLRNQIVMATGYVSDPLFFLSRKSARLDEVRAEFLERLKSASPQFVVVTNEQWPTYEQNGYEKLNNWPEFEGFLKQDYVMTIERGGNQEHERGYRIYVRKG